MDNDFDAETFDALRCMVNFARSRNQCRLSNVKGHAFSMGFSVESVNKAVKFWAEQEARKED